MGLYRLRAKSWGDGDPPESVLLFGHLRDALEAADAVLETTGVQQLAALGLPRQLETRFRSIVRLAAAVHDLGKANDHFQAMVYGRRSQPQGLRHEWVTLLLLERLAEWLRPAVSDDADWTIVQWAVAGHHPGYDRPMPPRRAPEGAGATMRLLLGHPDMAQCLEWLAITFRLGSAPALGDETISLTVSGAFSCLGRWEIDAMRAWARMGRDSTERLLVAAVKACLISADVAASALPRAFDSSRQRMDWIRQVLCATPTSEQIEEIVQLRLTDATTGRVGSLRPFQRQVADAAADITFVRAGCGTGKTVAAYHWAAKRAPGRRLYFCYPTTGTATEGFRDYLFDEEEGVGRHGSELVHSRRAVDFEIVLRVNGDHQPGEEVDAVEEAAARIGSLHAWTTPIVSCTTDTVLGIVQNHRRGLFAWPALAQGAFVFDEIHAYDDQLFGALLRFLETMRGAPVLLMTASLPEARLEALRRCAERRSTRLPIVDGPADLEERPRYHRLPLRCDRDPLPEIRKALSEGGKVLWVRNTVALAMEAAELTTDYDPIIYHSRFRYRDRVRQHTRVISAFRRDTRGPVLAICTQVAEMSLHLEDVTMVVTDIAPIPALIQRLGRLGRELREGDPTRPFAVCEPIRDNTIVYQPYSPSEIAMARQWLDALPSGEISQADLERTWRNLMGPSGMVGPSDSAWLDGGPRTTVAELRQSSPGLTVVMAEDLPVLRSGEASFAELSLPMPIPPRAFVWRAWPRWNGVPIAPFGTIDYHPERGAKWRKAQ